MRPFLLSLAFTLALAAGPGSTLRGDDTPPSGIKDDADLFSADAIAQADREIAAIREQYHLGVFVETIPKFETEWFHLWDRRQVNRFLVQQAEERAEKLKVDGIYIAICKKPRDVSVVVWPPRQEKVFTRKDRERVRKMLARLLATHPDEALLDAVTEVRAILANEGHEAVGANEYAVGGVFAGLVAVWVFLLVVRRKMRKRRLSAGEEVPDPHAGGPARLGTMLGVPSAAWGYDRLLPAVPRVAAPPPPAAPEPPAEMDSALHPTPADDHPENAPV